MSDKQQDFGAAGFAGNGARALGQRRPQAVVRREKESDGFLKSFPSTRRTTGSSFVELRYADAIVRRGFKTCGLDHCRKCGRETFHEYKCVQPSGPRIWRTECIECRAELQRMLEAES